MPLEKSNIAEFDAPTVVSKFDMKTPMDPYDHARYDDLLKIDELWRLIGNTHTDFVLDNPETLRSVMDGLDYLVVRDDSNQIVGAISVLDCKRGGLFKIDSLAVDPHERGKGYARALARGAIELCMDRQAKKICTLALPASQPLLSSLGFEVYKTNDDGDASMFLEIDRKTAA